MHTMWKPTKVCIWHHRVQVVSLVHRLFMLACRLIGKLACRRVDREPVYSVKGWLNSNCSCSGCVDIISAEMSCRHVWMMCTAGLSSVLGQRRKQFWPSLIVMATSWCVQAHRATLLADTWLLCAVTPAGSYRLHLCCCKMHRPSLMCSLSFYRLPWSGKIWYIVHVRFFNGSLSPVTISPCCCCL